MEFKMINLIVLIGVLGTFSASACVIAKKWKLLDWYELNRKSWMGDVCIFCICFWLSCLQLGILFFFGYPFDWLYLFAPFASAVLGRMIYGE